MACIGKGWDHHMNTRRRTGITLIACILISLLFISTGCGEEGWYTEGDYQYSLLPDGTVQLERVSTETKETRIPDELGGRPITRIADYAFENVALTSISIPDTVTYIGNHAFHNCRRAEYIHYPRDLKEMGQNPYSGCTSRIDVVSLLGLPDYPLYFEKDIIYTADHTRLIAYKDKSILSPTNFVIPETVQEIDEGAFYLCNRLKAVTLPQAITEIRDYTFYHTDIQNIMIPDSVQRIGRYAFQSCDKLTSVTLGMGVTEIDTGAFADTKISSFLLPNSVTFIGGNPFSGCKSLKKLSLSPSHPTYEMRDNLLMTRDGKKLIGALLPKEETSVIIPEGTEEIAEEAFRKTKIIDLHIPENITRIGESAFEFCDQLVNVQLPENLTRIEEKTFYGCTKLHDINLPDQMTAIGDKAFMGCNDLWRIMLPSNVQEPGNSIFVESGLKELNIPEGWTTIPKWAFESCHNLRRLTLPAGLTRIEAGAFRYCESLRQVELPDTLVYLGKGAFQQCTALERIVIPASVVTIEENVFDKCENVTLVVDEGSAADAYAIERNLRTEYTGKKATWTPPAETAQPVPPPLESASEGDNQEEIIITKSDNSEVAPVAETASVIETTSVAETVTVWEPKTEDLSGGDDRVAELMSSSEQFFPATPAGDNPLLVRATPDDAGFILGTIDPTLPLLVLDTQGEWAHVTAGGLEGYIPMNQLETNIDLK